MCRLLSRGNIFFDVGAHYGWISLLAADCVGKAGRVIAFEPAPVLTDILTYHKRVNRLQQLQLVFRAVADTDSERVPFFVLNDGLSFRNSLTIGADDTPYVASTEKTRCLVPCITLDRFVEKTELVPNLIKIDVEGAELLVLRGAEQLLRRSRPYLILGVHPYWLPRSQTVDQIFELLFRCGYKVEDEHTVIFNDSYLADYLCIPDRNNQ